LDNQPYCFKFLPPLSKAKFFFRFSEFSPYFTKINSCFVFLPLYGSSMKPSSRESAECKLCRSTTFSADKINLMPFALSAGLWLGGYNMIHFCCF